MSLASLSSPSSSRWCPTPEQVMILEEFYRAGIRTPSATQIPQITCYLSYHGKIEGKNVFYWFQNHKARERQKLRKTFSKHRCRHLEQVKFLNSTSCQLLHGLRPSSAAAAAASFGLHKAPFCTCISSSSSSSSVVPFRNQQDAAAKDYQLPKRSTSDNHSRRKCGDPRILFKEYDMSWRAAVSNPTLCSSSQPQPSPPALRTLQLFPTKANY